MRNRNKQAIWRRAATTLACAIAFALPSCGGGGGGGGNPGTQPPPPTPSLEVLTWDDGAWDQKKWQ